VTEQRIARLPDAERRALRALAVFNRPAGPKLLAAVARLDVDQVRRALATAEAQGLIRVVDTEDGRPRVVFRHPNIREVLLAGLRAERVLPEWHAICARVLEERALENGTGDLAPVAETLAVHLERAEEPRRALRFFLLAVDHALSQFAFDDALALSRRAARLASGPAVDFDDVVAAVKATGLPCFLSNDIDGTDDAFASATGTPEPGGLHPDVVVRIIERVGREVGFVGADMMEVAPQLERRFDQAGRGTTMPTALRYLDASFAGLRLPGGRAIQPSPPSTSTGPAGR
jgi:hypothetical protein